MGVGEYGGYDAEAFQCPRGMRAVGIGARSSCYSLVDLKVWPSIDKIIPKPLLSNTLCERSLPADDC